MPDRLTDEQIAEWGTWVDGVPMDAGVDITPMLHTTNTAVLVYRNPPEQETR